MRARRWRRDRSSVLSRALAGTDLLACVLACQAAGLVTGLSAMEAAGFAAAAGIAYPLFMFAMGVYSVDELQAWASGVTEAPKGLVGALLFTWPLFGAADLIGAESPALTALAAVVATVALSTAGRGAVRASLHRSDPFRQRAVIVGSGVVAGQLAEKLRVHPQFGLIPIGLIDDELHSVGSPDLPQLGRLSDLPRILAAGDVERVIIAFSRASHEELLSCIRTCRDQGVAVDVVPRLFEFLDGASPLATVGGLPLLSVGTPRLTRSSQIAKRALDIVLSAGALALLLPLLLLIAVAVKLESRGPALFRQRRIGRDGREFQLIKFRSMWSHADAVKAEFVSLNEAPSAVMFKIRRDPRVTRVGRLLRRLSLDELPQLINVLKGEMSLVGPRPLIPEESAALLKDWQARRLDLRPGLTGIWQIQGRSDTAFEEMVRLDYQYVAGWSLARDVEIIFSTIPAVLSGRGAY